MRGAVLGVKGGQPTASSVVTPITFPANSLTRVKRPMIAMDDSSNPSAVDDLSAKHCSRALVQVAAADWRMWYEANTDKHTPETAGWFAVGYATSTDGINWTKQGVVMSPSASWETDGSTWGEVSPNTVMYDPGASVPFRMWYHGMAAQSVQQRKIGYATSSDGLTWTKYSGNPIFSYGGGAPDTYSVHEPMVFRMSDGTYRCYYNGEAASGSGHALMLATSPDGLAWTRYTGLSPLIAATAGNLPWVVARRNGYWVAWQENASGNLQVAVSLTGIAWQVVNTNVLAGTGVSTDPDRAIGGICGTHEAGAGNIYVSYTGLNISGSYPNTQARFDGACLASIADPMQNSIGTPYSPAVTKVQNSPAATATAATVTATLPVAATAGNLLVACHYQNSGTVPGVPAGWTQAVQVAVTSASPATEMTIFYKVSAGGETGVTVTNGASVYSELFCFEFHGLSSNATDGTSTGTGGGANNTGPQSVNTLTPATAATHVFVGAVGCDAVPQGFSQWASGTTVSPTEGRLAPQSFRMFTAGSSGRMAVAITIVASAVIVPFSVSTTVGVACHHGSLGVAFK